MATTAHLHPEGRPAAARVDYLVDENGQKLDVPDDSEITVTDDIERSVGATSPTSWWQMGLIGLGIVAFILLMLQIFNGTPGTDVQPGTPVAVVETPAN
ncbi:MAG: hypothetical protein EOP19_00245 [Hyphomicrobiales bacterium]|nr:MAG: hypothetical protein EOP19_00245 [Hyphomicrobiales bacterium]